MANKTANIDFGQSVSRMNRMTNEKPRPEQIQNNRVWEEPETKQHDIAKPEEAQTTQPPIEERRGPGRKKRENNVRSNPKTIFFDDATDYALAMVKLNNSIDKKDLVLAATRLFLDQYYQPGEGRLSEDGVSTILRYLRATSGS